MKKYINKLFPAALGILLLAGCESETNMPELTKAVLPRVTADPTTAQVINMLENPDSFTSKVIVDLYYGDLPQEAVLVVAKNGNYSDIKTIQTVTPQFPVSIEITGVKLRELFAADIVLGDYFEIGLNTKYNGVAFTAFNPNGVAYNAESLNLPGAKPIQKYTATYLLDLDDFTGEFHVEDEWWEMEYDVTISRSQTSESQLIVENMMGDDGDQPFIIIDVDMATQIPKINNQVVIGDLNPFGLPYTNMRYNGAGEFDIPNKIITFGVGASVDQGSWSGSWLLVFTKK
ncbi:MAG: hypothetical protein LBI65_01695 [Candidatus Symbiothrix sp.]|jgi:hypothetical protein|nr:hypothetical protein [Candidatus Symbiothrix sp.]